MPIFEYECSRCGHVTSFLEKAGAKGPHECEQCGSAKTKKACSTFAARGASEQAPACRDVCESPCCQAGQCPAMR